MESQTPKSAQSVYVLVSLPSIKLDLDSIPAGKTSMPVLLSSLWPTSGSSVCRLCAALVYALNSIFLHTLSIIITASADSIPREILNIPGAMQQLQTSTTSDFISAIWARAEQHQSSASETRLGQPMTRPLNANLQKTPTGIIHAQRTTASNSAAGTKRKTAAAHLQQLTAWRDMTQWVQLTACSELRSSHPVLRTRISVLYILWGMMILSRRLSKTLWSECGRAFKRNGRTRPFFRGKLRRTASHAASHGLF